MKEGDFMAQLDYAALGKRIRTARRKKNMTQEKLGEICSLSAAHIGHIERGTRIPSLETVFTISSKLGVSVDWLLFDSIDDGNSVFSAISRSLPQKDDGQVRTFISAVKALADKIDEL